MENNKIIAKINGKEITEADVQAMLQGLGQNAMQFYSPEGRKKLVDEMVNQELFYFDAIDSKLDEEDMFKQEIEYIKTNVLKQYAIRKMLSTVSVEEKELEDFYNENKERFNKPALAKASHILVKTKEEAENIEKEIKEGLEFEEAASKYSTCPSASNGGDLGEFEKERMVPEFGEKVFSMNEGEISEPVETQFGFHLIKLVKLSQPSISSFEEVKDEIQKTLVLKRQQLVYLERAEELKAKYPVEIFE